MIVGQITKPLYCIRDGPIMFDNDEEAKSQEAVLRISKSIEKGCEKFIQCADFFHS